MPRWSGPPIQTKGVESNLHVMLAITLAQMRRFGISPEERLKFEDEIKHITSFEYGCNLIRQWFPLDIDLIVLNNCPHKTCQYPGCPKSCEGRPKIKVKSRTNGHGNPSNPR